jgi:hypothetical protein
MHFGLDSPPGDDPAAEQVRRMRAAGLEVPGIVCLLAARPDWTVHLNRLTHGVMRGPGRLPVWQRELVAAVTSRCNGCPF